MNEGVEKEIITLMKRKIRKPLYQVSDKYAKPVISLFLIQNDLKEIKDCLKELVVLSAEDGLLVKSLWKNAIITYGKIFSKSVDGYSSLERSDCIPEKYYYIHDELIKLRNSFIAHRGENEFENSMLLTYEKKKKWICKF